MNSQRYSIETKNLTKAYQKTCVSSINLKVPEACVYGFLGPNGAGKTTTMKMLLGLVKPTAGEITLLGHTLFSETGAGSGKKRASKQAPEDIRLSVLRKTGSLIESPSYYQHLTGRENLEILCTLKQIPTKEIDEVLSLVRMENQQHKKAGHYSLGMKQRLGLAGALLGHPKLLLLDEPTNGLDPAGIQEMRELICALPRERNMTVMVSSHLLSEMDQMADYVGIIHQGELIWQDSLSKLHAHSRKQLRLRTSDNSRALCILQENKTDCSINGEYLILTEETDEKTAFLVSALVQNGVGILRLMEYQRSLEDIFLSLTGKQVSL